MVRSISTKKTTGNIHCCKTFYRDLIKKFLANENRKDERINCEDVSRKWK